MRNSIKFAAFAICFVGLTACDRPESSDYSQQKEQERILMEGTKEIGMPAITNFRERRLLKDILERRDRELTTFTYLYSEMTGKLIFLGESIGYGIPYATQFTNPSKLEKVYDKGYQVLPQADPNGLFSPASAEGTWVFLKDPNGKVGAPVYIEPRIVVSPFKLKID